MGICDAIVQNLDKRFDVKPGSALHLATVFEHTDWPIEDNNFVATWGNSKIDKILVSASKCIS